MKTRSLSQKLGKDKDDCICNVNLTFFLTDLDSTYKKKKKENSVAKKEIKLFPFANNNI